MAGRDTHYKGWGDIEDFVSVTDDSSVSDDGGGYDSEDGRREDDYLDSKGDTASQSDAISKSVDQPENTNAYEDTAFHTRSYYLSALGLTPTKGKIEAKLLVDILRRRYGSYIRP